MLRSTVLRARLTLDALRARFAELGRVPDVQIAPQDLRTEDPTIATDVLSGRFAFAGKVTVASDRSPFSLAPPSEEWAAELHGFAWLRHLRATNTVATRASARHLFESWLEAPRAREGIARAPEVTARRVLSLLAQSPLLLEDADMAFYRRFARALAADVARLRRGAARAAPGLPRLLAEIALTEAALSIAGPDSELTRASTRLDRELARQVLGDGGHVSRHPGAVIELLADLLPLRQAYIARSVEPAPHLSSAIDRMVPMLRFFRHGDGAFVLANGMGPTPADLVATLLATDDTQAPAPAEARDSGYVRLSAGSTLALVDAGAAPPAKFAGEAHAGALAFELSDGRQRILVNCGMPASSRAAWRPHARATAAHSTLVVADTSSAGLAGRKEPRLLVGPRRVAYELTSSAAGEALVASHDGYARKFGLIHRRSLALASDGSVLLGEDRLEPAGRRKVTEAPFAVRFHLHPAIRASRLRDGRVVLVLPDRSAWEFTIEDAETVLEESVFLAATDGPRRTEQIVVHGKASAGLALFWQFARISESAQPPRRGRQRAVLSP